MANTTKLSSPACTPCRGIPALAEPVLTKITAAGQMARPGISTEPQPTVNEKVALSNCETPSRTDSRWQAALSWQRILSYAGSVKKVYHDQPTVLKTFLAGLGELYDDFSLVGLMSFIRQTDKLFANDDEIFASLGDTLPSHPWILAEYHIALLRRRRYEAIVSNQERTTKRAHLKRDSSVKTGYSGRLYSTGLTILGLTRLYSTGLTILGLTSGERRALLELEPLLATSSAALQRLVDDEMD